MWRGHDSVRIVVEHVDEWSKTSCLRAHHDRSLSHSQHALAYGVSPFASFLNWLRLAPLCMNDHVCATRLRIAGMRVSWLDSWTPQRVLERCHKLLMITRYTMKGARGPYTPKKKNPRRAKMSS